LKLQYYQLNKFLQNGDWLCTDGEEKFCESI